MTGFGDEEIRVMMGDKPEVERIIKAGHYSHSVAWASSLHFLVFTAGRVIGALQYGPAMNPASGASVVSGTKPDEWLELNRLWLSDDKPENCTSRVVAFSLKMIKALRREVAWVQSFADSRCNKLGAVYQACSFLYVGSHQSTFYLLDGEWFHKSMLGRAAVDKRGWGCGPRIAYFNANRDRATAHTFTQYRYLRFLKPAARKRLLLPVLPYPKAQMAVAGAL